MIATGMTSTCDEYRHNAIASAPVYPAPTHPLRRVMMHALAMIGLGMGVWRQWIIPGATEAGARPDAPIGRVQLRFLGSWRGTGHWLK